MSHLRPSSKAHFTYPLFNVLEGEDVRSSGPVQLLREVCHIATFGADRLVQGQQLHSAGRTVVPLGAAHHQQEPY